MVIIPVAQLAGGFKYFLFSTRILGEMIQFDLRVFFSNGLVQPPTSPTVFVDAPVGPSGSLGWQFQGGSPSLPGGSRLRRIEAGVRFFQWKKKVGRFACNLLNGRKYRGNCITYRGYNSHL